MAKRKYLHTLYGDVLSGAFPHAASGMTGISSNLFDGTAVMYKPTIGDVSGNFPATTTSFSHVFDVSSSSLWNASKRYCYLKAKILCSGGNTLRHKLPHENVDTDPNYHNISRHNTTTSNQDNYILTIPINSSGKCNLWWSTASAGVDTASGSTYISIVGFW